MRPGGVPKRRANRRSERLYRVRRSRPVFAVGACTLRRIILRGDDQLTIFQ